MEKNPVSAIPMTKARMKIRQCSEEPEAIVSVSSSRVLLRRTSNIFNSLSVSNSGFDKNCTYYDK